MAEQLHALQQLLRGGFRNAGRVFDPVLAIEGILCLVADNTPLIGGLIQPACPELFCHLCAALNSLPETQGRRVDACVILGKSYSEVARAEGVHESAVRRSVERGLEKMKQYLKKCL